VKKQKKFTVLIERDEDGYYLASCLGCGVVTLSQNPRTLMKRVREAIELASQVKELGYAARVSRHSADLRSDTGSLAYRARRRAHSGKTWLQRHSNSGQPHVLENPDGRTDSGSDPLGETIGPGLLRAIQRDVEMSVERVP